MPTEPAIRTRSVIFADWEVRALRDNRKTQFRRVVKPQPPDGWTMQFPGPLSVAARHVRWEADGFSEQRWGKPILCPFGKPGDRLVVKETWVPTFHGQDCIYRADPHDGPFKVNKWKPASNMPDWASRDTLELTGVRVERVQEISESGAFEEGCTGDGYGLTPESFALARQEFADIWNPRAWKRNAQVWVGVFRRLTDD